MILDLPEFFRNKSPDTYPPFKNGKYMEEYFYTFFLEHKELFNTKYVYIPVFWTNLQVSSDFEAKKEYYNNFLKEVFNIYTNDTKYFTIVQHDDGVLLNIPQSTLIFGACSGHIPLPLIYEDTHNTLKTIKDNFNHSKNIVCSFIGSETHLIRSQLKKFIQIPNYFIHLKCWELTMNHNTVNNYISIVIQSIFTLAPRGYGRSSFRFFECFLLNSIPIYIYDDVNWLPYQDILDYSKICIVIHENEIDSLPKIIESIPEEKQKEMLNEIDKHKSFYTLDFMCKYICDTLKKNNTYILYSGKRPMNFLQ